MKSQRAAVQKAGEVALQSVRLPFTRVTNQVLFLLCAMYFITYVDRVNVSTAAEAFGLEFGLSKTQARVRVFCLCSILTSYFKS